MFTVVFSLLKSKNIKTAYTAALLISNIKKEIYFGPVGHCVGAYIYCTENRIETAFIAP